MKTLAVVGRPNVGKSTLFNRFVGRRLALVHEAPGMTRDIREDEATFFDLSFRVMDTAGFEEGDAASLTGRMRAQAEKAIEKADAVLFLTDGRSGLLPDDEQFADLVRRSGRPAVLAVNKCEGRAGEEAFYEAYRLGLGDPVAISAEHAEGLHDLYAALAPLLGMTEASEAADEEVAHVPAFAVVGRPNVGKSTLVNALLADERMLTGPEAGITRDSIEVSWTWEGRAVRLVDTAGLRRQARVRGGQEKVATSGTMRALRYADVVVVVLDGERGPEKQDLTIARRTVEEGRGLVIALNKQDLLKNRRAAMVALRDRLDVSLAQAGAVRVVSISARKGQVDGLMEAVFEAYEAWNTRIPTAALNRWLEEVTDHHPPPLSHRGRRIRLRYLTQPAARPPRFVLFGSTPEDLPESYRRYLINALREDFQLEGVPIRLALRKGENPYIKKR